MFTVFTKGVVLLFYDFGVYPITENLSFFLQLVEVIRKTAANPGETFTQSYVEKYEAICTLHPET